MKKILTKTAIALLNPVSPVITLFVGWLLTVLVTQTNDNFPHFINIMIENPIIIIIFITFWLIFSVIYTEQRNVINNLNEKIVIKEQIIKEKDRHLQYTSGVVLNRSGDFANFNKNIRFNETLKSFVENNIMVESAQIYKYSIKRLSDLIIIRVEYEASYVYEGIDINNLAQTYYEINYCDYNTIKDIINIWKRLSLDDVKSNREKDALINVAVKEITDLFKKYHLDLVNIKDVSEIANKHFTEYRILTLLIRLTRRLSATTFDKTNILGEDKKDIEDYLLNGKRTGILNSVLLGDTFVFKYTRNTHKKNGRAYISFPANIWGDNYISVFSVQVSDLDPQINLQNEIMSLQDDFVKRLCKK